MSGGRSGGSSASGGRAGGSSAGGGAAGALGRRLGTTRIAATWSTGDPGHRAAILLGGAIGATLLGAFLFGAWHLLVGYVVNGNPRAGIFGLALATVAGILLVAVVAIARRRLPRA